MFRVRPVKLAAALLLVVLSLVSCGKSTVTKDNYPSKPITFLPLVCPPVPRWPSFWAD